MIKAAGHDRAGRRAGRQPGAQRRRPLLLPARRSRLAARVAPADVSKEPITDAYFGLPQPTGSTVVTWLNAVIQGILLGGLYALFATGLSLAFGVMRFVNLAHGDLAILAAFVTLSLSNTLEINPLIALVIVLPLAFVVGYLLQRLMLRPRHRCRPGLPDRRHVRPGDRHPEPPLREVHGRHRRASTSAGSRPRASRSPTRSASAGSRSSRCWCAVVVLAGLALLLQHTKIGRAFRATSDDEGAARLMAIDVKRVFAVAMALAVATVALAGVLSGSLLVRSLRRPDTADLRVRGGDHRRPRIAVGHVGRRHHLGRLAVDRPPDRSAVGRARRPRRVPRRPRRSPDRPLRQGLLR